MKVYKLMLLSLFFTAGCQFLPWKNPCSSDHALKDVSKHTKKSEKEYMCSAVFEYEGQKRVVEYAVKEIHSGKEKLYRVEIIDTNKVE